ncbi:MAG: flagellar hook-basal body complex protein, partial [Pseudomonadota bacterium]
MAFNIALSGLSAASSDLRITGNNIANSSTVGFKSSRAEFADVYASSLLGAGSNQVGSGVKLANISQQFDQGTISFTNNSLDLAIDGSGFFVLSDAGARTYTRAGAFGLDESGFLVSANGNRVQGFTANDNGNLSGIQGDLRVNPSNLAPNRTGLVEASVNLDARSQVLSQLGTTVSTNGSAVGVANLGLPNSTPTTLNTLGPPAAFDYSVNTASGITATNGLLPFNFSINSPSAVAGSSAPSGFDFSINSPSSLTGSGTPTAFNFADKPSALTGPSGVVPFDFSGANSGTFDVTVAGATSSGTRTVTLNSNITNISDLVTEVNSQLSGIGVQARPDPDNPTQLQFFATVAGEASTITVDNYAGNGTTAPANVQAALSGIVDGASSIRSSFDISVTGSSADGTATITLTDTISQITTLLNDIRDQLDAAGIAVGVREDLQNPGRLQFYSLDDGVASTVTVDNFQTTDADVTTADIAAVLRVSDGASSAAPGAGAIGITGSLTEATFDLSISGGSGLGGNASTTVTLNGDYSDGNINTIINDINTQLNAVPGNGIDVRAEEDPNNPGRIRFAATVPGETSTITIDNFVTTGVPGDIQTQASDISGLLGGIVDGASDASGNNTNASFQVSLSGSSVASQNQTVQISLDSNVSTLQDLINDIRDDLIGTGIGIDVREDPQNLGRLQFYALNSGEASVIRIDPNDNATLGIGVSAANVEAALGGISLGQSGLGGSSNQTPDPFGTGNTIGQTGNISSASFDLSVSGSTGNNGTVTINLTRDIQTLDDLISDIRDELLVSGLPADVREDPVNPGRLQFFSTRPGEASSISLSNLDTSNIGVSNLDLSGTLNLATGVSVPGVAAVSNGYLEQTVDVVYPDGTSQTITIPAGNSAAQTSALLGSSNVLGVGASATTVARVTADGFDNSSGLLEITLNGVPVSGGSLSELATSLNSGVPGLGTVSAAIDVNGDLVVTDAVGNDLVFA